MGERRERERERVLGLKLALVRMSELVERKRENDLNAVGSLKTVESSSTGQTG